MDHDTIASFMEITSCGSQMIAVRLLVSCNWRIEDAIELYFTAGAADDEVRDPILARSDTLYNESHAASSSSASSIWAAEREEPPSGRFVSAVHVQVLPSTPEIPATPWEHDDDNGSEGAGADEGEAYWGEEEEYYSTEENVDEDYLMQPDDSNSDNNDMDAVFAGESTSRRSAQTLNDLFRPPYELMFSGSFHEAKVHAARQDRWLLINLQARGVFASHMHNRDLWSNEVIAQVININFIFSLMEKTAAHGDEGSKVSCFYKLDDDQLPTVLVLDPITGQLLSKWCGSLQADDFLTDIAKYTETKPSSLYKPRIIRRATTATPESNQSLPDAQEPSPVASNCNSQEPAAPVAPKHADEVESAPSATYGEPAEGEKICRVRIRFPRGDVVTREFGSTRPVATLFAYCGSVVQGQDGKEKQPFRITRMSGHIFEELRGVNASFEDLDLNCSTVSVVLAE